MITKKRFISLTVVLVIMLAVLGLSLGIASATTKISNADNFELFTVSGDNSSIEKNGTYVASEHENPSIVDGKGNPVKGAGSVSGVKVSLAAGDTFNYTKVIDLTGKTKDEPLFEFALTPETIGKKEVYAFEVTLTDAYDATNVIAIHVVGAPDAHPAEYSKGAGLTNGVGYLRAGFDGMLVGQDHFWNELRKDEGTGAIIYLDFAGIGGDSQYYSQIDTIDKNVMSVFYEDATKELFANVFSDGKKPVVGFTDESYFDYPWREAWRGFKTGECFMAIRGIRYEGTAFNFVLTEVDGQKVSDISPERAAHLITVDTLGFNESELPPAVVGKTYPVFNAVSVSPYYGALTVNQKVYFGDESGDEIAVVDGKFACAEVGTYTIVYAADDGHGKTVEKTIVVTAEENVEALTMQLTDYETEGFVAGDVVRLPDVVVSNHVGLVKIKKQITFNGKTVEILDDKYQFLMAGEYEFTYSAEDMVGKQAVPIVYVIDVASGTEAKFTDYITMPKYFIGGRPYTLPVVYARNYTDGSGDKIKARIYVTDESGERFLPTGKITPLSGSSSVTVTYDAELNGTHAKKDFVIPVIDIKDASGNILADKLFYAAQGSAELTVNETDVTIKTSENAVVDYINPVASNGFEFSFSGDARFTGFKTVTLILSDAENAAIAVKFNYASDAGKTVFYVGDDGKKYELTEKLYSSDVLTLSYKQVSNAVSFSLNTKTNVAITKTIAGEAFNGFPSGMVTARIMVGGVTGSTRVAVKQISNQMIGDLTVGEFANPIIFSVKDYGGEKKINSTTTLFRPYVADAIDPGLTLSLTVYDPSGNPVSANDGTILQNANGDKDYDITVAKYGTYRVNYFTRDTSGNPAGFSYTLEVLHEKTPEIVLDGEVPTQVEVGKKTALPAASIGDDADAEVKIYVITEQGQFVVVSENVFTFKSAGKYKIFYWYVDEAGNMTCNEYVVTAVA